MTDFEDVLQKGRRLQVFLQENPAVLRMLELMDSTGGVPVKQDKLLGQKEVREILKISPTTLQAYVKKGLLKAYYTPPRSGQKFWLSEVLSIPKEKSTAH